jgi:flagellar FliJ protein
MAQFKFNLKGVLRQRELAEDQRQRTFAEAQRAYAELEAQLKAMDDEVKAAGDDLRRNHLVGRIDVGYLAAHRRFGMAMQRKALAHAGRMAEAKAVLDAARAALVEAAKQRKMLEKLKEKRQSAWADDHARRDQAATDEVAQQIGVRLARATSATPGESTEESADESASAEHDADDRDDSAASDEASDGAAHAPTARDFTGDGQ